MAIEFEIYYILFILVIPFLIFSLIWTIFGLLYPLVFVWGIITSGKNIDKMIEDVNRRESETRKLRGKDPLSTMVATEIMFLIQVLCMPVVSLDPAIGIS